ncbi:MAG: flagellar motor protein MotB [Nocardioidaceae bacterium]
MSRARRREPEEEHVNHDRWLVTYADMITLLMVLFIVMFAISQVDQKRFEQLKEGMAAGFGQTSSPFKGQDSVMEEQGIQPIPPVEAVTMDLPRERNKTEQQKVAEAVAQAQRKRNQERYAEAEAEVNRLDEVRRRLLAALRAHHLEDDVQMKIDRRGLTVSLVSKHIVFAPNLSELTPRGLKIVEVLSPVLRDLPDKLEIDGHTNQVKVRPKYYPTDWELSSARATTVLRYLDEHGGVSGKRLSAAAFGHEKPLIDPSRADANKLNKRVDIVVLSSAADETRALFDQIVRQHNVNPSTGEIR